MPGKTLGSGTYAIVKEAVHIKTGKYFACKVINKKLMEGREYMVRNEIAVLKKVSQGHRNIVTLHDYFEVRSSALHPCARHGNLLMQTAHNLYLVFDLCTGGELFDRIFRRLTPTTISDAAELVRTVLQAVVWIHDNHIVHRDLKPENLLFRSKKEDADIMIADFEICGTPGYMAPEIFLKSGHGKPVDVWAMGVITYFLLCGYTPFDRDTQQLEMEAILKGDYKFEPEEYWMNVSGVARDFVKQCLTVDPLKRPTAHQMLQHKWLSDDKPHFVEDRSGAPKDLLPFIKERFDAKKTWRKAVFSITAVNRMVSAKSTAHLSAAAQALAPHLEQYKEESEKENMDEDRNVMHYGDGDPEGGSSVPTSPNAQRTAHSQSASQTGEKLAKAMKEMSIDKPES
ncbi:hypothetical protein EIP91_006100 [Steccherinum ochraceum]|uniref:Protein kinase domain-containing protein n=1 Tax=Steccherinum ochraceum TaxID=92696 RepID=A0A4R0RH01_9APHY|nr:hypothetical protein EIP91_006100 [Steccherinum ochraceum]